MTLDLNHWLLFLSAALALNLSPGPDMFFVVGVSLGNGRRPGVFAALGIAFGALFHVAAAASWSVLACGWRSSSAPQPHTVSSEPLDQRLRRGLKPKNTTPTPSAPQPRMLNTRMEVASAAWGSRTCPPAVSVPAKLAMNPPT